jgi:hypothetical protein
VLTPVARLGKSIYLFIGIVNLCRAATRGKGALAEAKRLRRERSKVEWSGMADKQVDNGGQEDEGPRMESQGVMI